MSLTINKTETRNNGKVIQWFTIVDGENTYKWHGVDPLPDEATLLEMIQTKIAANGEWTDTHPVVLPPDADERTAGDAAAADLAENLSFADIDTHIDTVFSGLSTGQKNSLKKLYKTTLYLLKKGA